MNDVQCENVFSAVVQANGTITSENLDWISGNCTNSSESVCTFNSGIFTQTPSCQAIAGPRSTQVVFANIVAQSSSSVTIGRTTNASTIIDPFTLICTKQGADFKAKSVITGTFQDVVTSPGAGKPVLCSAKISSTGVISDQIGGCFASCTNATTPVCTFTSHLS